MNASHDKTFGWNLFTFIYSLNSRNGMIEFQMGAACILAREVFVHTEINNLYYICWL